ncbi:MAG: hypothetical protein ACO1OB_28165, partial [Archangium sp.]
MRRNQRQRGFSMLVVMGLLLIVTVAAVTTLQMVGQEASLQAQTRREAEAFFAAEAGLAEAREIMRLRAEAATNFQTYTTVMGALTAVPNMGAHGETWFEVIPQTSYTLTRAGA